MIRLLCASVLFVILGCGGGGGGSASSVVPRFSAADVSLAPGTRDGTIEVALLGDAPLPVLAQIDLVFDTGTLSFGQPTAIASLPTVSGHLVAPGRFRVVFGDAAAKDAAALPTGKLASIPFELGATVGSGSVLTVKFEQSVGALSTGAAADTESAPGALRITVP